MSSRAALLVTGSAIIGAGVSAMLWNNFGAGPLDVFIGALRQMTGLPLTFAVWATIGTLALVAWSLGRRPGIGTLVGPFVAAPVMQTGVTLLGRFEPSHDLVTRLVVHLLAIGAIGIGAGCVGKAGLGSGTGELLTAAAAERTGRRPAHVRTVLEVIWLSIGGLLGGPIGVGTVLVAFLIGPSVANGLRIVDRTVTRTRVEVAARRAGLIAAGA